MIHRIELIFQQYLKNETFEYDSKNWTFFNITPIIEPWKIQRIDFFQLQELNFFWKTWRKEFFRYDFFSKKIKELNPFSWLWLKELNPFSWLWLKRIEPFFLIVTQRIEPSFKKVDSMNKTFVLTWLTGVDLRFNMTHRGGPSF